METQAAGGGGLEAKHYILAAFTAGFIAVAVITIIFVVLSPAHVSFSVTSASSHDISNSEGVQLDLTIAANNTSRRAAVLYQSIFVDMRNLTDQFRADVSGDLPLEQPPRDVTEIHASAARYGGGNLIKEEVAGNFSVMVTAVARFKVGVAWTRPYDIKVMCGPVDFFANKSSTAAAGCQAA